MELNTLFIKSLHPIHENVLASVVGAVIQATGRTDFEDGLWIRQSAAGQKRPSEGPHYTCGQYGSPYGVGSHDPGAAWARLLRRQTKVLLLGSAQSVVLNYSCYCGVRIELA